MKSEQLKQKESNLWVHSGFFPIYLKKKFTPKKSSFETIKRQQNSTVIFINFSWSGRFHCKISYIPSRRYVHI